MKHSLPRGADVWMRLGVLALFASLDLALLLLPPSRAEEGFRIVLDATQALDVEAPIEVRPSLEDPRRPSLHFPEAQGFQEASQPLRHKPRFRFEVPSEGSYYLWARALWRHVCANSFQARVDGGPLLLLGNDEEFGSWHWVRHQSPLSLKAGSHELVIDAAESNIDVDRLVLSDDPHPSFPETKDAGFADDFEGGVPRAWIGHSPAVAEAAGRGDARSLRIVPNEGKGLAYAVRSGSVLSGDLYVGVRARRTPGTSGGSDLALIFDHDGPDDYRYILLAPGGVVLGSVRRGLAEETTLAPSAPELSPAAAGERSWDVDLERRGGELRVWHGGRLVVRSPCPGPESSGGEVGAGSRGGGIDIERVEACSLRAPSLRNGFYNDNELLSHVRGFEPVSGEWRRGHMYTGPITYPLEARAERGRAVIVAGERWWTRYSASTAFRLHADAWAGLVFQYRGPDDYAMLRARAGETSAEPGELQLVLRRDGKDQVLARTEAMIPLDRWRTLGVEVTERGVSGLLDERRMLEVPDFDDAPGRVGLVSELVSERKRPPPRPPVLFLDKDSAPPLHVQGPLKFDERDPGAFQVFLYQDPRNYYRYGIVRHPASGELGLVLERLRDGRAEILQQKPCRVPKTGSPGSEFAAGLQLAVAIENDRIQTWIYGQPFADVREPLWKSGRMGVQSLRPPADADFDEVLIAAPQAIERASSSRDYRFSPADRGARDLAAWDERTGEWGIGIFDNGFLYSLLARTTSGGVASLTSRFPLEGNLHALRLSLRPRRLAPSQVAISVVPAGRADGKTSLSLVLELVQAEGGGAGDGGVGGAGVRPILRLLADGREVGRSDRGRPWREPQWHDLRLAYAEGRALAVSLDGETAMTVTAPERSAGAMVELTVRGPEGTVFGFRRVELESAP